MATYCRVLEIFDLRFVSSENPDEWAWNVEFECTLTHSDVIPTALGELAAKVKYRVSIWLINIALKGQPYGHWRRLRDGVAGAEYWTWHYRILNEPVSRGKGRDPEQEAIEWGCLMGTMRREKEKGQCGWREGY